MIKDILGRTLQVGDKVVYIQNSYRDLIIGHIKSIANVKVKVETVRESGVVVSTQRYGSQVVKVIEEDLTCEI